jgi:hypothetical protein
MADGAPPRPVGPLDLALALLLAAAAFAVAAALRRDAPLELDTAADLLRAQQCVHGGACPRVGPPTSLPGFLQGALWIRFLAAALAAGLGAVGTQLLVLALQALGAAVTYLSVRRFAPVGAALLAGGFFACEAPALVNYPTLWNPSLLPLPLAVFFLATLAIADGAGTAAAALAALALGLCVDLHVLCAILGPFLLFVVVAWSRRPPLTAALALPALVAPLAAFSDEAWRHNAAFALDSGAGLAIVATLFGAAAAAILLRRRLRALPPARALALLSTGACMYLCGALELLARLVGHRISTYYFAPALPALACVSAAVAVAVAALPARLPRLGRPFAVRPELLGAAFLALAVAEQGREQATARERARTPSVSYPEWTLAEVEALAGGLLARGIGYEALYQQLRGPYAYSLLAGLGAYLPVETGEPREGVGEVLVLKAHPAELPDPLPPGFERLDLGDGQVAVLRRRRPSLHRLPPIARRSRAPLRRGGAALGPRPRRRLRAVREPRLPRAAGGAAERRSARREAELHRRRRAGFRRAAAHPARRAARPDAPLDGRARRRRRARRQPTARARGAARRARRRARRDRLLAHPRARRSVRGALLAPRPRRDHRLRALAPRPAHRALIVN